MTNRIPPSLNWLIDKYARTSGEIINLKKKISKVQQWVDQLNELEKTLTIIQESLKLHEIQIDLENIKPVRPSILNTQKFKYGEPGKLVIQFLRSKYGLGPISKSEIAEFLLKEHAKMASNVMPPTNEIGKFTGKLLGRLADRNYIIRKHDISIGSNSEGLWEINPKLMPHKLSE